jgi:hypothetical protein
MPGFMTRIGVSEIVFPWTIPNINKKTNTIDISYNIGTGVVGVALTLFPIGFYTPYALASALQAKVRGLPGNPLPAFTMTYGNNNVSDNDPTFEYDTGNVSFSIAFNPKPYNSASYPYNSQTKQLFDLLGFTSRNRVIAGGDFSDYTFCQAIRYVDIVCNQLTNSQAQKDQTSQTVARDMLARIYIMDGGGFTSSSVPVTDPSFCPVGCAPTTIYRNYTMPKQIQWIPNQNIPGYLQFSVYDDTGALLDETVDVFVTKGIDWSMTMLVSEC